ncbi:MAG: phosphoadenosine phosphosulfate reductase family protein [Bacteroidales bacterium]|nr:phosphoadenosine phosphosulfate reductase family protein [Bacteroidales bacterium]
MNLNEKIDESIALIRKAERLAVAMHPEGLWVGFSGGRDSQLLLELVKMAGVKHRAVYSVTTNDPPENVYFIRRNYPEVEFTHPAQNFFTLVEKKGLPTRKARYCCAILKEGSGAGRVVLTGVRADESARRAKYNEVSIHSNRKEHSDRNSTYSLQQMIENEHRCIKGKDKVMVYPVLRWTAAEVQQFHADHRLSFNTCYEVSSRVGCIFCPFSSKREIEHYERDPLFKRNLLNALGRYVARADHKRFETAEEYYEWWKTGESISTYKERKRQLNLNLQ